MPELPEVETVRRVLLNNLANLKINDVIVRYDNIIDQDKYEFIKNVKNKTIIDILRRGKFLIFKLDKGYIISHLRMEGKYFYVENNSLDNKHIHVIFKLSNNYDLLYQDVRKFGRMLYIEDDIYNKLPLSKVGIDLILDKQIDYDQIYAKIINKALLIKETLLDQSIIAGLGNIYVDEVLFASKIRPDTLSKDITMDQLKSIINESKRIFDLAIEKKGTTIRSYTSSLNVKGNYQDFLMVHTKEYCKICNSKIEKIKIGGRTTYFCKNCQK